MFHNLNDEQKTKIKNLVDRVSGRSSDFYTAPPSLWEVTLLSRNFNPVESSASWHSAPQAMEQDTPASTPPVSILSSFIWLS